MTQVMKSIVAVAVMAALSGSVLAADAVTPATAGAVSVLVSGQTYPANGVFPQTGFVGATFTVLANGKDVAANGHYQWLSSQPWVSIDKAGVVTFTGMPKVDGQSVTLTATPASGGAALTTTFTLKHWFINAKAEKMTGAAAAAWCQKQGGGFVLPAASVMTASTEGKLSPRGATGTLWSEWGPMALYRSGWQLGNYWTADTKQTDRAIAGLVNGNFYWVPESGQYHVACSRPLP